MPAYNFYFMDNQDHIGDVQHVVAGCDQTAIYVAKLREGLRPMEIWCGARLVSRLEFAT